jgi:hypothetical protein
MKIEPGNEELADCPACLFPHAHAERSNGRWRVILTAADGSQTVMRRGLAKSAAECIAAAMRTVDRQSHD